MAAPVKPSEQAQGGGGSSSQIIPETKPPQAQPTSTVIPSAAGAGVPADELARRDRLIAAQEGALRDQHRANTELTQRMRELEQRVNAPPPPAQPSQKDRDEQFWKSPSTSLDEFGRTLLGLVKDEMARTVTPLNDKITKMSSRSAYDDMKDNIKVQYADIWPQIEGSVDEFIKRASDQGNEVSEQLVGIAALTAAGALYRGLLPGVEAPARGGAPSPVPPEPSTQARDMTPPHLRPSAPAAPRETAPTGPSRTLTENEHRLRRERGWTEQQYLDWLDVPSEQVIHSQIGRTQK